jgi:DNA polymerase-3 subunit gamma/tau
MPPSTSVAPISAAVPMVRPVLPPGVDLAAFRQVIDIIGQTRNDLASAFRHAAPLAFGPDRVVLAFEETSFGAAKATSEEAMQIFTRTVRSHFGTATAVDLELTASSKELVTLALINQFEKNERIEEARRAVREHPLVKAAVEILGAELRDIQLGTEPEG